jgi:O-antigen/teichoic acid export membrane protein
MSSTLVERLAQTPVMQRLPPPLRDPFILNSLISSGGNFFAGLAGFAFQALLAAALGGERYSEVASLISIFYMIQILHFVAMAVAARLTAPLAAEGRDSEVQRVYRDLVIYATLLGTLGMVLFILASPFLHTQLRIGLGPLLILSATVPLNLLLGVSRGVVQGAQRFVPLSLNFIIYGTTTLVFLPVLLHFQLHAVGATLAMVLGLALCNLAANVAMRDLPRGGHHGRLELPGVVRSSLAAAAGPGIVTVFFNMDVILAKYFLPNAQAGIYSAMSLLGKILYFGTISISVVMFPRIAALHAQGRSPHKVVNLSLALVVGAGMFVVAVYFAVPDIVIRLLLRKQEYLQIGHSLGIYSLAMLGLAVANVLVYYFVAMHRRRYVFAMALGAVVFFGGIARFHGSFAEVALAVTVANNVMAAALLFLYLLDHPRGGKAEPAGTIEVQEALPVAPNVAGAPGASP